MNGRFWARNIFGGTTKIIPRVNWGSGIIDFNSVKTVPQESDQILFPINSKLASTSFLFFLLIASSLVWSAEPVVSNISLAQRLDGSKLVDINFDLFDADDDSLAVALHFSDDGGQTWTFPVVGVSGDIGLGVVPGVGKLVVWDMAIYPEAIALDQFKVRVIASDVGVLHNVHSPDNVAILDLSAVDWTDRANIEKYSRSDLCQIMASRIWPGGLYGDINVFDQMRELNPDIKIVGYVSVKSAQLSGEHSWADAFWHDWLENTRDYWCYTTTGDTLQDWENNVVLNILNPDCRQAMVETILEFHRSSINQLDGIYWDYFNNSIWVPDYLSVEGEPDLDEDGIAHDNDPDEREAFRAAQVSLVEAVRDSLGEDFLMIFNGQRAYADSSFASLADGVVYELFPTLFFPNPDMKFALDPDYQYSLFRVRHWMRDGFGGPYLVLTNPWLNRYMDMNYEIADIDLGNQFRAVSMMVDGYACWASTTSSTFDYRYGWTKNNISLGLPLGPVTFEGDFMRREFQYGRVEIEMTSGGYPNPFDYRIWALGKLVEELSIPYHYPE